MIIKTKEENYQKLLSGAFGNRIRMWESIDDIKKDGFTGNVSIRTKQIGTPTFKYDIPVNNLEKEILDYNVPLVFSEAPPDDKRTIQGELWRNWEYYYLNYTFYKAPMRIALQKQSLHASGIKVKFMLEHYLNPNSYADMMELLNQYPDSVIEFTAYSINLGIFPHRNTIIWEVRNY